MRRAVEVGRSRHLGSANEVGRAAIILLKGIVFPLCAALCWLAAAYKLRHLWTTRRQQRDIALWTLVVALVLKGVSFLLSTPKVSAFVDRRTGVPNLGALGIHVLGGVLSSAAFLVTIVFWVYPHDVARPRALRRLAFAEVVAATMIALWAIAGPNGGVRSPDYLVNNAHRPLCAAYLALYVAAFGSGMIGIVRLAWRYGPSTRDPWLRRGLYLTAAGAGCCVVYCLNRLSAVVAAYLGGNALRWEVITPLADGVGILLIVTGLTIPSWGPRCADLVAWCRDYRDYQTLRPLWLDLCRAAPEIALHPPRGMLADRLGVAGLGYRLHRRMIEIQDGRLALRPYTAPVERDEPAGASPPGHVEATALRAALAVKAAGGRPTPAGPGAPPPPADADPANDRQSLVLLARAYRRTHRAHRGRPRFRPLTASGPATPAQPAAETRREPAA